MPGELQTLGFRSESGHARFGTERVPKRGLGNLPIICILSHSWHRTAKLGGYRLALVLAHYHFLHHGCRRLWSSASFWIPFASKQYYQVGNLLQRQGKMLCERASSTIRYCTSVSHSTSMQTTNQGRLMHGNGTIELAISSVKRARKYAQNIFES